METTRELNVAERFELISTENAKVIQNFYDKDVVKTTSDRTYDLKYSSIITLCNLVNHSDILPIRKWDVETAKQLLRGEYHNYERFGWLLRITRAIMLEAGCPISEVDLKRGLKITEFTAVYTSSIVTFEDMNDLMVRSFEKTHKEYNWWEMNDWSTSIVLCYLLWLGFTKKEIVDINSRDYYPDSGTFCVPSFDHRPKVRQTSEYPEMQRYVTAYYKSYGYIFRNDYHNERFMRYAVTDSFLKTVFARQGINLEVVENYGRKIAKYFGFKPDEILMAGRLDKLFIEETMNDVQIIPENYEKIIEILGMKKPKESGIRSTEVANIIEVFPTYKEQRNRRRGNPSANIRNFLHAFSVD